jgi:anti-sigma regulatory factor (Ser/Thr protein kinase)
VRELLSDRPVEIVEAVELMTSELSANCVRHARTGFELAVTPQDPIRVEIRDSGPGQPRMSHRPRDTGGRGLRIVDSMADEWGIIPVEGGKVVWFTLSDDRR